MVGRYSDGPQWLPTSWNSWSSPLLEGGWALWLSSNQGNTIVMVYDFHDYITLNCNFCLASRLSLALLACMLWCWRGLCGKELNVGFGQQPARNCSSAQRPSRNWILLTTMGVWDFRWDPSSGWHLNGSLWETPKTRTWLSCVQTPDPQELWANICCSKFVIIGCNSSNRNAYKWAPKDTYKNFHSSILHRKQLKIHG